MSKKPVQDHEWRISRIKGSRSEVIGRVRAPDEKLAIERAIAEYGITNPEHQKRLVAQRVEDRFDGMERPPTGRPLKLNHRRLAAC